MATGDLQTAIYIFVLLLHVFFSFFFFFFLPPPFPNMYMYCSKLEWMYFTDKKKSQMMLLSSVVFLTLAKCWVCLIRDYLSTFVEVLLFLTVPQQTTMTVYFVCSILWRWNDSKQLVSLSLEFSLDYFLTNKQYSLRSRMICPVWFFLRSKMIVPFGLENAFCSLWQGGKTSNFAPKGNFGC